MLYAFEHFLELNLHGQVVLDIGTRYGKMACLFALLGGKVIGSDLSRSTLSIAQREATQWNVTGKVVFLLGKADLSSFKDNSFNADGCISYERFAMENGTIRKHVISRRMR